VVAALREAGFRIAAQNTGRAYDVTTVFYNDGYEAEARRVAQTIDASVVTAMSSLPPERRLSTGVNVHVIVGADRR
jgi:aspartate aminotransferase-like enzyme